MSDKECKGWSVVNTPMETNFVSKLIGADDENFKTAI